MNYKKMQCKILVHGKHDIILASSVFLFPHIVGLCGLSLLIQILPSTLKRTRTEGNAKNNECRMYPVAKRMPGFPAVPNSSLADAIQQVKLSSSRNPFTIMNISCNYSYQLVVMQVQILLHLFVTNTFGLPWTNRAEGHQHTDGGF